MKNVLPESTLQRSRSALREGGRRRSGLLGATIGGVVALLAGTTTAQTQENYWLTTGGGLWNDGSNWLFGTVPAPSEAAYLILPGEFNIFATGVDVTDLYAENGDVDLTMGRFGFLNVSGILAATGNLSETAAASLTLRGRDSFSTIDTVYVGGSRRGPQFGTGVGHETIVQLLFGEPLSTLRFEVNESTPFICPSSITVVSSCEAQSGFHILGDAGFLLPGDSHDLIYVLPGAGGTLLPEFGLVDSPKTVDVELNLEVSTKGTFRALNMKSQPADTLSDLEILEGFDLPPDPPLDVLLLDLDRDGDQDIVVAMPSGKHPFFIQQNSGGYANAGELSTPPDCRAATVGDFDDDGWDDLAFASDDPSQSQAGTFLQILRNATMYQAGPSLQIEDTTVSLAPLRIPSNNLFQSVSKGIAVTGSDPASGRGKTRGYETNANDITKTGEIEIGDDPGPSDPIEDENKKDPDPPLGVAGDEDGLVSNPVLKVLRPTASGFSFERSIQTSGEVIAFDSGDIDGDGRIETLVLTDANRIDLLRPLDSSAAFGTVPVGPGVPMALKIGELGDDSRREVVVLMQGSDESSRIDVYRVDTIELDEAPSGSRIRPYLERRSTLSIADARMSSIALSGAGEGLVPAVGVEADPIPESFLVVQQYETEDARPCSIADLNGDGLVDSADLGLIFNFWGSCSGCPEDLDGNGEVDAKDIGILFANWGPC